MVHINSGFFVNQTLISRNMINVHAASNSIHKTLSQNEMDTDRYYQQLFQQFAYIGQNVETQTFTHNVRSFNPQYCNAAPKIL